ncbi:26S proteasome non-ATPase regulatory subunit 4 homolog [Rutidosis leptorrhynchoides]|uniref:26S proteasome non-ATPase regulatory subunit 4 homolog n=1 Tax=Rutidosis leptorrhynchoides TaxID=125765 RepID=UPI003A994496
MRRSLGNLGIGHTIRKALLLSSGGSGGGVTVVGRGRGTVSPPIISGRKVFLPPKKAPIDNRFGNREKSTILPPPSSRLFSVLSGAASDGGGKNDKVEEEVKNKPEAVVICIDTSCYMLFLEPYRHQLQLDCIQSYCRAKIESNPKNSIGVVTMSTFEIKNNLVCTSDLDKILRNVKYQLQLGGSLDFKHAIRDAWYYLPVDDESKMRALFFIGGAINMNIKEAKAAGEWLKERGVAVDVVNFWRKGRYTPSKRALNAFVAAANNDNNSHIQHVQVEPCTTSDDLLLMTRQLFTLEKGKRIARNKKAKDPPIIKGKKNELKQAAGVCT